MNNNDEPEQLPDGAEEWPPKYFAERALPPIPLNEMSADNLRRRQKARRWKIENRQKIDIARSVWKAADFKKPIPEPLGDERALELYRKLDRVSKWYKTDVAITRRGSIAKEVESVQDIMRAAEGLSNLLGMDDPKDFKVKNPVARLLSYFEDLSPLCSPLGSLKRAASAALAHLDKLSPPSPKGQSALDRAIIRIADIYFEFTDKEPGCGSSVKKECADEKTSEFIRFTKKACEHLEIHTRNGTVPSGSAIAEALRKKKRGIPSSVIELGRT
jgi:hypothetical protein